MPIYEYKCANCGHKEELLQFYQVDGTLLPSEENVECECGKWVPIRIISKTTFELKGSGWAKDNYSNKKE